MEGEHLIHGLLRKRDDFAWRVKLAEKALDKAKVELETIDQTLRLCGHKGELNDRKVRGRYKLLFARGELQRMILNALREGPKDDRALTDVIAAEKSWQLEGDQQKDVLKRVRCTIQRCQKTGIIEMAFGPDGNLWRLNQR